MDKDYTAVSFVIAKDQGPSLQDQVYEEAPREQSIKKNAKATRIAVEKEPRYIFK